MKSFFQIILISTFVSLAVQDCREDERVFADGDRWISHVFVKECFGKRIRAIACQVGAGRLKPGKSIQRNGIKHICYMDNKGRLHYQAVDNHFS